MYAIVMEFLERLGDGDSGPINYTASDSRIAMAVLLYRMMIIDGRVRETELRRYRELLLDKLSVSPDELMLFEQQVRKESESEVSLFPFTSIVKKMPLERKQEILQMMREISLSDNELHEFEINLVARTAELLEIPL